jgi:hypothetical protein
MAVVLAATQRVGGAFVVATLQAVGPLGHTALHHLAHAVVVQGVTEAGQGATLRTRRWHGDGVFVCRQPFASRHAAGP